MQPQPNVQTQPPVPGSAPPPAKRASWLVLIVITAIDAVLVPVYFLMAVFSGHALATGAGLSAEGLLVFAMGGASLLCPVGAWLVQLAGGGRRLVYALALVPLALPLLSAALSGLMMPGSSGLIVTPVAK